MVSFFHLLFPVTLTGNTRMRQNFPDQSIHSAAQLLLSVWLFSYSALCLFTRVSHFREHPIRLRHCRQPQPHRMWSPGSSLLLADIIRESHYKFAASYRKPWASSIPFNANLCFIFRRTDCPAGLSGTIYSDPGGLASSFSCQCSCREFSLILLKF